MRVNVVDSEFGRVSRESAAQEFLCALAAVPDNFRCATAAHWLIKGSKVVLTPFRLEKPWWKSPVDACAVLAPWCTVQLVRTATAERTFTRIIEDRADAGTSQGHTIP